MSEATPTVSLTIDGRTVTVPRGTTIWEAAQQMGIDIPVLCHSPRMRPVGVCRVCVVDLAGSHGDVAAYLDLQCERELSELIEFEHIDGEPQQSLISTTWRPA